MSCPRESDILRLVSDELSEEQAVRLKQHLAECESCDRIHNVMQFTARSVDAWTVDVSGIDLVDAVESRAAAEAEAGEAGHGLSVFAGPTRGISSTLLRAAAAILLAVGLGVAAGRLVKGGHSHSPEASSRSEVTSEEVTRAMGLEFLGGESSTGLLWSIQTMGTQPRDEGT